jgi:hypothetical protein
MSGMKPGDPNDPRTICGPVISARQRDRVQSYLDLAIAEGGTFACGGGRPADRDHGFFIEPTVVAGLTNDARVAREEIFGPVLTVIAHDGDEDAIRIANDSPYGLSASVFSADPERAQSVANRLRVGTVNVNGNYTNSSGTTFNSLAASLIRVGGTLSNTTAANFSTDTGAVDYRAATTQTVLATVKSSTYGGLTLSGGSSAVKTLGGSVVVNGLVTIAASTEFAVGTSNNLTLNAASPFSGTGTFTASATSATVNYNRNDNQNVRSSTYYNLTLADGGTKSAQGNITLASGGALTNNGTFDLMTFDLDMSAASITVPASDTVRTQGNVSFGTNTFTFGGLFLYEKTAANQSIGGATYTNLEMAGGAQKDFPTTTVSVNGVYTAGGAGARAYGTGTFAYGGSGASVTQAVVSGESYYNLTITGAGDTTYTVAGRKQANGSLVITNALSVAATNVLDMQGNTFTTLGSGTNSGKLMWSGNNTHVGGAGVTELYGIGTGSVADGAYGILLFTGSGTKTVAGAGTSATNTGLVAMSIASLAVVDVTGTLTVNGDLENDGLLTNSGSITVQ